MSDVVLDASALLAALAQEPRAARWSAKVSGAIMSAVNLSEVIAKLADVGWPEQEIKAMIEPLSLSIVPFDAASAYDSGLLRPQTKRAGLSLGDRACLALAVRTILPVLTADRAWAKIDMGAQIMIMG